MSTAADRDPRAGGRLIIGSRRSRLARVQAEWVGDRLQSAWPELDVQFRSMSTVGDRDPDTPIPEIGGKGLFTEDLERALQDGEIDLAVHSLKDLPTDRSDSLALVAIPAREDPRDVLVVRPEIFSGPHWLEECPSGSTVGTSSVRRTAQLRGCAPQLRIEPLRGNVETRLERLLAGDFEAIILAAAGLRRLGLWPEGTIPLEPPDWLPAPGQGALGVQARQGDSRVAAIAAAIDDRETRDAVTAERALLRVLEGGCNVPVSAFATAEVDRVVLNAAVYSVDGGLGPIEGSGSGPAHDAAGIGERLAEQLLGAGAAGLIHGARGVLSRDAAIRLFGPTREGTLVFTNGCFDRLHDGHRSLLERAKALGDRLIVGLNSDASVRRLKGTGRPVLADHRRALALAALDAVDAVTVFEEDTPLGLIEALRPDVLVKGADYDRASVVGGDIVEARGGRVVLLPLVQGASTTSVVKDRPDSGDESP